MSKKNKDDRDQSWRKELGLEEGPQKKSKKISEKNSMAGVYILLLICFIFVLIFYTYHGRLYTCKFIYFFFGEMIDADFYNINCYYKLFEMKRG